MASLSSPGIGSNLDVDAIISKLMSVEARPLTALATKEASYQAKLSAYGTLIGTLNELQTSLTELSNPNKFQALSVKTADNTALTASIASQATAGNYNINVTALAQSQTLTAAGHTSTTAAIGEGGATTLTFQFGTKGIGTFAQNATIPSGTVTIDARNNSLQGIRDSINNANIGVTATIVSDGSSSPYRLVLTSSKTGANASMKVSVTGDSSLQNLLAYDPVDVAQQKLTETSSGKDAALTVNGIAVNSATNSISEAIQGVTMNVLKLGTTTLSVTPDTNAATAAVNSFVKAYNGISKSLKDLTAYNPETKEGGLLLGDATARTIQSGLRSMLSKSIPELTGSIRSLSDIGVSFQKDGLLAVDSTKLQKAVTSAVDDVTGLFAAVGKTTDSLISFTGSTAATKPGKYSISVTSLATKGFAMGSVDLSAGATIVPNTTFQVKLDGTTASVKLTEGTYTSSALATMIQSMINSTPAFSSVGSAVSVTIEPSGLLKVASTHYGSASNISLSNGSGTSVDVLFGASPPPPIDGTDVAGTIGGVTAEGSGQMLIGAEGSNAEGLKLKIDGGTTQERGFVTFGRGYAYQLSNLVGTYLGDAGLISGRKKGIDTTIKDIAKQREQLNARLTETEKRYRAQFTKLDQALSSMSNTSSYLTQQLAALANLN